MAAAAEGCDARARVGAEAARARARGEKVAAAESLRARV